MANAKQTPGQILRDVECYSANVAEFAKEIRQNLIDPATDQFRKVDVDFFVSVVNTSYSKFQETMRECEGNEVEINLPDGPAGLVLGVLLQVLGIKL